MLVETVTNQGRQYAAFWMMEHNGFAFQLMAQSGAPKTSGQTINRLALEVFENFHVRDPKRVVYGESSASTGDFESSTFLYAFKGEGSRWIDWQTVTDDFQLADFGLLRGVGSNARLIIAAVYLGDLRPSLEALTHAFGTFSGFDPRASDLENQERVRTDRYRSRSFDQGPVREGDRFTRQVRVVSRPPFAYLLMGITTIDADAKIRAEGRQLFDRFELVDLPAGEVARPNLEERQIRFHISFYRMLGRYYFEKGNVNRSLPFITAAYMFKRTDARLLRDVIENYAALKKFEEGRTFLEAEISRFPGNGELLWRLASFQNQTGAELEAIRSYEAAIDAGIQSTDVLQSYVGTLIRSDRSRDAIEFLQDRLVGDDDSDFLRVSLAEAYAAAGEVETAEEIFLQMEDRMYFNTRVAYRLVNFYIEQEREAEALAICDDLVAETEDAEAHFYQGICRLNFERFQRAQESFERCLER